MAFLLLGLLVLQAIGFWHFYGTQHGRKAVYRTWYAWVIDVAGIVSGTFIMWIALALIYDELAIAAVPREWAGPILFLVGSWQAVIHGVKWLHRGRT